MCILCWSKMTAGVAPAVSSIMLATANGKFLFTFGNRVSINVPSSEHTNPITIVTSTRSQRRVRPSRRICSLLRIISSLNVNKEVW